jgi:hypothetical protein
MACPLYVDFTRMCLDKIPAIVKFTSFQNCTSEQYVDCPVYQICKADFHCKYINNCTKQYSEKIPKFLLTLYANEAAAKVAKDIWTKYCLSPEISKTCAKYQLLSKGEIPPLNLMPDGRRIRPFDLIFKRKRIIRPPE